METAYSPCRNFSHIGDGKLQCRQSLQTDYSTFTRRRAFFSEGRTDRPARPFFVTEIIREKILLNYEKEVPYSVEVEVEEFKEDPKRINIMAVIYVERDSQKGIIIGKQGEALKKVGTEARLDIEAFFGKKFF